MRTVLRFMLVPICFAAIFALLVFPVRLQAETGSPLPLDQIKVTVQVFSKDFNQPTFITSAHDGSNRIFVVEKTGRILILRDGAILPEAFLDISNLVDSSASERGLLSIAFHPEYKTNGLFYIYYTARGGTLTIAQYKVSANPDLADTQSARIMLQVVHQRINHNGGQLEFGPDGYLYAGLGDGGGGGDPDLNGQNPKTLLGKLLRLDVNNGTPYGIPADNPFVSNKQGRPEVWAYGLRNPWRFSFDRTTNDLYIADVGQDNYEEVDIQKAGTPGGLNYGWHTMEGLHCYAPNQGCDQTGLVLPVVEDDHSGGNCSITGVYVYRASAFPHLQGTYFFSDYCSGHVWAMQQGASGWKALQVIQQVGNVSTFGEDEAGELYLADISSGTIYHLVESAS